MRKRGVTQDKDYLAPAPALVSTDIVSVVSDNIADEKHERGKFKTLADR